MHGVPASEGVAIRCGAINTTPDARQRFDSLHVDTVGPFPESQGYTYLLTIVDRFTNGRKPYH